MSISSVITAAAEGGAASSVNPWAVGIVIFGTLVVLMAGLLFFGAGRPHS